MAPIKNRLLEALPTTARRRLLSICEPVQLAQGETLSVFGAPISHAYFPTGASISLIASIAGSPVLEIGMVGQEGMLGAQLALGVPTSPLHALVQAPGACWRAEAHAFATELSLSEPLQQSLNRYLCVLMAQWAASSACLRFHHIEPRLARWLLMCQDRTGSDSFLATHEFLAHMLGVRRVGITVAAGALQRKGLITYHRGDLQVLDRAGLEHAACGCYNADRQVYASGM